jgi:hypothetical protein
MIRFYRDQKVSEMFLASEKQGTVFIVVFFLAHERQFPAEWRRLGNAKI